MVIAVLLKVDNGGTATVLCTELKPDPLFSDQVVLMGLIGLTWPVAGQYLKVVQWSVKKESVLNWMVGDLRKTFEIDTQMLEGPKDIPWPEGSSPHQDLVRMEDVPPKPVEAPPAPAAPEAAPEAKEVTLAPVTPPVAAPAPAPKAPPLQPILTHQGR